MKAKETAEYQKNVNGFMEDLKNIRLACQVKKKSKKVKYQLETMPKELKKVAKVLGVTDNNIRVPLNVSVYI